MKYAALVAAVSCVLFCSGARADEPFPDGKKAFERARDIIEQQYVDSVSDDDMWKNATGGLVGRLGDSKWNTLLSPSSLAALQGDLAGEIVGIGVEIDFDSASGMVIVVGTIPGSPAEKAGLRAGDRILRIDDKSLKGLDLMSVGHLIRGKRGSTVTLALLREAQVVTRTLARQPLAIAPVDLMPLPGDIAYVVIRGFNDKTPDLLHAALQKSSTAKALILDVRDNAGGLFDKMMACAGELLPKGSLVVTTVGRGGKTEQHRTSGEPVAFTAGRVPIVVLVNHDSASSAEVLAAALQHDVGARLVGERTFGKWSVQRVEELGNGWALKLTSGLLRSAAGQVLDGKGLEPDLQVDMKDHPSRERDAQKRIAADAQLRAAVHLVQMSR